MPDLISLPRQVVSRGHPELIEITGFRLQFIPYSMRGRNDKKGQFPTFYETIKVYELKQGQFGSLGSKRYYSSTQLRMTFPDCPDFMTLNALSYSS